MYRDTEDTVYENYIQHEKQKITTGYIKNIQNLFSDTENSPWCNSTGWKYPKIPLS